MIYHLRFTMTLFKTDTIMRAPFFIISRPSSAKRFVFGLMVLIESITAFKAMPAVAGLRTREDVIIIASADRFSPHTIAAQLFDGFTVPPPTYSPLPTHASRTYRMDLTAYTSTVEECDNDPFITADGSVTRDGIVATNVLPFNTRIRIPAVFGDKIFTVHDRMNKRYGKRVDIWMERKEDMREFGIKRSAFIEVLEWGDNATQWKKG